MDGWLISNHDNSISNSSSGSDLPQNLYEINSFCTELGYREEDQFELEEAGIEQSNLFMEFESRETGLEMSALSNIYMQMDLESLLTQYPQHYEQEQEVFFSNTSSSSLRSLSIESPDSSSLINNSSGSSLPDTPTIFLPSNNAFTKFPRFKNNDLVIAEAISEIFSSSSSTSSKHLSSTFKPYNSLSQLSTFGSKDKSSGQKMIKSSIAYLRTMNLMENGGEEEQQPRMSSHMISERKRREKLNGSFYNLRTLLPPCAKKDKASVLCKATDYLKTLKAQIFDLQKKNQMLELHQIPTDIGSQEDVAILTGITNVQITESLKSVVGIQRISLKITVRLQCDLLELVLRALEYLKERRAINFLSLEAKTYLVQKVLLTSTTLVFDIKVTDWDEASFKQGVINVVDITNMSQYPEDIRVFPEDRSLKI